MVTVLNQWQLYLLSICVLTLSACGGSGSGSGEQGSTNVVRQPTTAIDRSNEEQLAIAATEGVRLAVNSRNAPTHIRCPDGGTASEVLDADDSSNVITITKTFENCSTGTAAFIRGTVVFNGIVVGTSGPGRSEYVYENFAMTYAGVTMKINLTSICTMVGDTPSVCSYHTNALGIDGKRYFFNAAMKNVAGNDSSGYTVWGGLVDPDYGYFAIHTKDLIYTEIPVFFNCNNGQPSSGEIQFADKNQVVVTVTYNDCASFTVSYNGSSRIYGNGLNEDVPTPTDIVKQGRLSTDPSFSEYFDFSLGAPMITGAGADIKGTSHGGVNFSNDVTVGIVGRRIILLSQMGSINDSREVPVWNDTIPWVAASSDCCATPITSISVGSIWAVYTQEGNYAVLEITSVSAVGSSGGFTFDYIYNADGSRHFTGF